MAAIVYLNTGNQNAQEVKAALGQISQGIATLRKLNGLRQHSISASVAVMAANFGVADNTQAQALSDRWNAIMAWLDDEEVWITTADDARVALLDLVEACTWAI